MSLPSSVKNLVLYFQVHQPLRLKRFSFFDIGSGKSYIDDSLNREILERIASECYVPTNVLLLNLIKTNPKVKITFSISGIALDQMERYTPEVLDSFRALAKTGCVEFLCETQYHSLACMVPGEEFEQQVLSHAEKIYTLLGVRPTVFRNTELIYNDDLGSRVYNLGFNGIFCDGVEKILAGRSPHHLYKHPNEALRIFLRNYRLSDDIAFRYQQNNEVLTADKYMAWLNAIPDTEDVVTVAMDYETFGEHQKRDSGILTFLKELLSKITEQPGLRMVTPSEVIKEIKPTDVLNVPHFVSWADNERDLSAWLGNAIQQDAFDSLLALEKDVKKLNDSDLLMSWRQLQTSDHFYYMSTKKSDDGKVHAYFSPYPSPYEAFINYMNVLSDFTLRINKKVASLDINTVEEAYAMI